MNSIEEMIQITEENEKIEAGAETVSINEEKGIAIMRMKDGKQFFKSTKNHARNRTFGEYVLVNGEMTEEKRLQARNDVIDKICDGFRLIAEKHPEWLFIEKEIGEDHTVACKFMLPEPEVNENNVIPIEVDVMPDSILVAKGKWKIFKGVVKEQHDRN